LPICPNPDCYKEQPQKDYIPKPRWEWFNLQEEDPYSGTQTEQLTISAIEAASQGFYRCMVTDQHSAMPPQYDTSDVNVLLPDLSISPMEATDPATGQGVSWVESGHAFNLSFTVENSSESTTFYDVPVKVWVRTRIPGATVGNDWVSLYDGFVNIPPGDTPISGQFTPTLSGDEGSLALLDVLAIVDLVGGPDDYTGPGNVDEENEGNNQASAWGFLPVSAGPPCGGSLGSCAGQWDFNSGTGPCADLAVDVACTAANGLATLECWDAQSPDDPNTPYLAWHTGTGDNITGLVVRYREAVHDFHAGSSKGEPPGYVDMSGSQEDLSYNEQWQTVVWKRPGSPPFGGLSVPELTDLGGAGAVSFALFGINRFYCNGSDGIRTQSVVDFVRAWAEGAPPPGQWDVYPHHLAYLPRGGDTWLPLPEPVEFGSEWHLGLVVAAVDGPMPEVGDVTVQMTRPTGWQESMIVEAPVAVDSLTATYAVFPLRPSSQTDFWWVADAVGEVAVPAVIADIDDAGGTGNTSNNSYTFTVNVGIGCVAK